METKNVDPHAMEGHSKAHADAFNSLMERIGKACQNQQQPAVPERPQPGFGSQTHRVYPDLRWGR